MREARQLADASLEPLQSLTQDALVLCHTNNAPTQAVLGLERILEVTSRILQVLDTADAVSV